MARLRVYVSGNQRFRRAIDYSRRESYGQSQVRQSGLGRGGMGRRNAGRSGAGASVSSPKLTTYDALSYLKEVKDTFLGEREKYDIFLNVMQNFKAQRMDTIGVTTKLKDLFKGHPRLIIGFNTFLPKRYEITLNDEDEAPPKKVEFEEAINFVNKIKTRFQNDDHVYKYFLDFLDMYWKEHKGINEVYREVAVLFSDHPDLIDEFTRFMPDTSGTANPLPLKRCPMDRIEDYKEPDNKNELDLSKKQHPGKMNSFGKFEDALKNSCSKGFTFCEKVKESLQSSADYLSFLNSLRIYSTETITRNELQSLVAHKLGKYPDLMEGFSEFLDCYDRVDMYTKGFTFCEEVKERLGSPADYQTFLKYLRIYSREIITREQLQCLVANTLGKHPYLMKRFNEFIERYERAVGFLVGVMTKWNEEHTNFKLVKEEEKDKEAPPQGIESEEAISFAEKVKERFRNDNHVYKSFLNILKMHNKEHKNSYEVYHKVAILFKDHSDLFDEFTKLLPDSSADFMLRNVLIS
ncbi:paired amphipathic helix protein Sin3-like 2 [Solanum dulcamara]|uniref:paired amphipathic helix protein Sin3-like 2 n=1 Tax=Solanum dulcamara TaxID=45834 RepID=UPI0024862CB1|nr:paired amphipathic helix protein Sin3-like 2 [Solanum dulcamara]